MTRASILLAPHAGGVQGFRKDGAEIEQGPIPYLKGSAAGAGAAVTAR